MPPQRRAPCPHLSTHLVVLDEVAVAEQEGLPLGGHRHPLPLRFVLALLLSGASGVVKQMRITSVSHQSVISQSVIGPRRPLPLGLVLALLLEVVVRRTRGHQSVNQPVSQPASQSVSQSVTQSVIP